MTELLASDPRLGPFGLPELVALALAIRIVLAVAWIRFGHRPA